MSFLQGKKWQASQSYLWSPFILRAEGNRGIFCFFWRIDHLAVERRRIVSSTAIKLNRIWFPWNVNFYNRLASHFSWQRNKPQKRTFVTWQSSCRNAWRKQHAQIARDCIHRQSRQVEAAVNPLVEMRQDHVSCVINSLTGIFDCSSKYGSHVRKYYCLHFISE